MPNEVKGNVADSKRGEFKLSGPSKCFVSRDCSRERQAKAISPEYNKSFSRENPPLP